MQNEYSFKQFLIRNSYILVTAAWLVTISFIIDNYLTGTSSPTTVAKNVNNFIARQENDFDKLAADTALMSHIANNKYDEKELQELTDKKYYTFLYSRSEMGEYNLLFWSTQVVEPLGAVSVMKGKSGYVQLSNGYYVWRKANFNHLALVALIPIKWNYSITNDYLTNKFTVGENIEAAYSISAEDRGIAIKSKEGDFLFSLIAKSVNITPHNNLLASILRMVAAFFCVGLRTFYCHLFCAEKFFQRG